MTEARDSTHVDTVGEKDGRVVLNLKPPCERTGLVIHDGLRTYRAVKIVTIAVSIRRAGRMRIMHRIEAELLIPGHGGPIRDGVVVLDGSRIGYAGAAGAAPPESAASPGTPVTRVAAVMPGMWECHGHFLGTRTFDLAQLPLEPEALRAARCTRDLRAALDAGITSVRDVGGLGVHLARAVAEGLVEGPAIYGAGAILSTTGGHADLHSFPLDWMQDFSRREGLMRLADGPDDCARAVREQLRRNAKLIKVCASGGVLSEVDDPIHQQFTTAELRAIVEVAGLADRVVAAHCHGKPGIMAALRAGVRTIEHGTYLDDECCDAMRESGAILVPTRTIIEDMLANKAVVPDYAMAKLEAIADIHAQAVTRAYEHGVTIAMGTDIALSGADLPNAWGQNGSEPGYLVKLGMSPLEAIEAATATGPLTLGPQAPRSGRLVEGYDADVITLDADPLADIGVLADPARITAVWTAGQQVKGARP
jgi:imidazolonepropionase-like amidohydrolase